MRNNKSDVGTTLEGSACREAEMVEGTPDEMVGPCESAAVRYGMYTRMNGDVLWVPVCATHARTYRHVIELEARA